MPVIEYDLPDRFIADTVGPPGERTFFLQASQGKRVTSVSLEKQQVSVLGERLTELLDQVADEIEPAAADALPDLAPMDTPIEDEFRVQSLSLAWEPERKVVVIEALEQSVPEDLQQLQALGEALGEELPDELAEQLEEVESGGDGQVLRVVLAPAQARGFAERCARAVEGGRPNCPFCGNPLDPSGHICPRANGYRR
ncbi:DUF3090 family protein [Ornithinicoccus hortensis]|uniref:Putative repeat protein (TIGR03847 family) n=1 Tax=Ornithinicoccus hortensis TaxID=82346 RepID=A0A542YSU6_9MICO|nr:DUF3090 family protein [Ornithinicoccus hortensis]TQL51166.1 putative repeat protein (TIGR03847 family) [Ornithinicoccus hortensis]